MSEHFSLLSSLSFINLKLETAAEAHLLQLLWKLALAGGMTH